ARSGEVVESGVRHGGRWAVRGQGSRLRIELELAFRKFRVRVRVRVRQGRHSQSCYPPSSPPVLVHWYNGNDTVRGARGKEAMRDHVRILGWLNVAAAVLGLGAGLFVMIVLGGTAALVHHEGAPGEAPAAIGLAALIVGGVMLLTCLPTLIVGVGLLRWRPW